MTPLYLGSHSRYSTTLFLRPWVSKVTGVVFRERIIVAFVVNLGMASLTCTVLIGCAPKLHSPPQSPSPFSRAGEVDLYSEGASETSEFYNQSTLDALASASRLGSKQRNVVISGYALMRAAVVSGEETAGPATNSRFVNARKLLNRQRTAFQHLSQTCTGRLRNSRALEVTGDRLKPTRSDSNTIAAEDTVVVKDWRTGGCGGLDAARIELSSKHESIEGLVSMAALELRWQRWFPETDHAARFGSSGESKKVAYVSTLRRLFVYGDPSKKFKLGIVFTDLPDVYAAFVVPEDHVSATSLLTELSWAKIGRALSNLTLGTIMLWIPETNIMSEQVVPLPRTRAGEKKDGSTSPYYLSLQRTKLSFGGDGDKPRYPPGISGVESRNESTLVEPVRELPVNRPFLLFLIHKPTSSILYAAKVSDPFAGAQPEI